MNTAKINKFVNNFHKLTINKLMDNYMVIFVKKHGFVRGFVETWCTASLQAEHNRQQKNNVHRCARCYIEFVWFAGAVGF